MHMAPMHTHTLVRICRLPEPGTLRARKSARCQSLDLNEHGACAQKARAPSKPPQFDMNSCAKSTMIVCSYLPPSPESLFRFDMR